MPLHSEQEPKVPESGNKVVVCGVTTVKLPAISGVPAPSPTRNNNQVLGIAQLAGNLTDY